MKKYLIHDFGEQFAREPVIRRMTDGAIICLFLTGGPTEPHKENIVAISRSEDNGQSWSEPAVLFSHQSRGVWATELFSECEVPFIAVHTYNPECTYRELQTFRSYSRDLGRTWSDPVSFAGGLNGVSLRQGIVMSNGEYLFPLYWQETTFDFDWNYNTQDQHPGKSRFPFRCGVAISTDKGQSFNRYGYIKADTSLWEPNCIELENGHILMYMRDGGDPYIVKSESFDYGRTWTAPEKTKIPNACTKLTLIRIRDNILLINNFNAASGFPGRIHLQIRISDDYCATWSRTIVLEEETRSFFYPHAFADMDGETLYVAYENAHQHYLAKIPFIDLDM